MFHTGQNISLHIGLTILILSFLKVSDSENGFF